MKNKFTLRFLFILVSAMLVFTADSLSQCLPYIGQTPPGMLPVKFVPNNSYLANGNWWWRSSPSFSPQGNEMYFVKYFTDTETHEIWYTKCLNDQWTVPLKAPFSTSTFDSNPLFLESNDTLYYYSQSSDGFIFLVTRISTGWSEPVALEIPVPSNFAGVTSFSITKSKTIYFAMLDSSISAPNIWSTADIYRTEFVNGQYTQPENIGSPINTDVGEVVGYVDPNERFMIYSSPKQGGYGWHDLYISTRNEDDTWNDPINLGAQINTVSEDDCATITPYGKYLFFTTMKSGDYGYSPYWVDAQVIYNLITDVKDGQSKPTGFNLYQNYPNPFNPTTTIIYAIPQDGIVTIKIFDILGQQVATLKNEFQKANRYEVQFNSKGLAIGVYIYKLQVNDYSESKKMMILK
jgi:hypothetical protein